MTLHNPNFRDSIDDAPFNMAILYYIRMSKLMDKKDEAAMLGDVHFWNNALKVIYRNIFFALPKTVKEELTKKFDEAEGVLSSLITNSRRIDPKTLALATMEASALLDEIDKRIMVVMDEKKMIFPRMEIKGGMKYLTQKYNL